VREFHNMRFALEAAYKEDALNEVYAYLSMSQVLTTPPKLGPRPRLRSFLGRTPMLLVWLPFLVQLFIFGNDLFTMKVGAISSPGLTTATLIVGCASLLFTCMLTYMCWHMSGIIDHQWMYWRDKANEKTSPKNEKKPAKDGDQSGNVTSA
jgi:hypothetical protein